MNNETLRYLEACQYAIVNLGGDAERYFARLHKLAEVNSKPELESIIRGWRAPDASEPPSPPTPGLWAPGSQWGDSVRVVRDRGIIWKLRCRCGQLFETSTGDTVPEDRRKCQHCLLADDLTSAKRELVFKLEETAKTVLEWHRSYERLVWDRVWKVCRQRGINDQNFAKELNALCWTKIAEKAGQYSDRGFKVSAWLGKVVDNCLKDHFKVNDNREKLAPTGPLIDEITPAPATKPEEAMPAKPVQPEGASPDGNNPRQANWDKRQKWNG